MHLSIIQELGRLVDRRIGERIEVAKENGIKVQCKRGCHHCCYQMVSCTLPEALVIAYDIVKRKVSARVTKVLSQHANIVLQEGMTNEKWFKTQTPCAFLRDGECAIYDHRPIACRTLSVTSEPKLCSIESGSDTKVSSLDFSDVKQDAHAVCSSMMQENRMPLGLAPMPVAVMWALMILVNGKAEFMHSIEGTPFADNASAALYWVRMETKNGTRAEALELLSKHASEMARQHNENV